MTCSVVKELVVECTEDEAWSEPFEHVVSEDEKSMDDWDVTRVEPNE